MVCPDYIKKLVFNRFGNGMVCGIVWEALFLFIKQEPNPILQTKCSQGCCTNTSLINSITQDLPQSSMKYSLTAMVKARSLKLQMFKCLNCNI